MVMIESKDGKHGFFMGKSIHALCMRFKEKVSYEDQEVWVVFQGSTGSGKSLKAMQWAYTIDRDLDLWQICFTKEEFINAVLDSPKHKVIIADEGITIFFSRSSMTKEGRLIAELINQIRQKNLCIFLCIPNILNLDGTVLDKLNAIVNVWEGRDLRASLYNDGKEKYVTVKGNAAVYLNTPGRPKARMLISYLKKKRANPIAKIKKVSPNFLEPGGAIGTNTKKPWYPVDEVAYRIKKEGVLTKYRQGEVGDTELGTNTKKHKDRFEAMVYHCISTNKDTYSSLSKALQLPEPTVRETYKRIALRFSNDFKTPLEPIRETPPPLQPAKKTDIVNPLEQIERKLAKDRGI